MWNIGIFFQFLIQFYEKLILFFPFINKTYSLVCHQQTNKLIYFGASHTLVCARCSGIYVGLLTASLTGLFIAFNKVPKIKILLISSIPMLIDVLLYSSGIYSYSKIIAFLSGFLFGSVGFLYFYDSIKSLMQEILIRK